MYIEAEEQLKASKEPFLQYQTELGCISSTEVVPTERTLWPNATKYHSTGSSTSSEPGQPYSPSVTASTTSSIKTEPITTATISVAEISYEYLALLDEIDSNTFPQYEKLRNLLGLLESLIETLNKIAALPSGKERSADVDCTTEMSRKVLYGEASEFINDITGIIDSIGNTTIAAMDIFLRDLRIYLVNVLPNIEPHKDRIDCGITTDADTTTTVPGSIEEMTSIDSIAHTPGTLTPMKTTTTASYDMSMWNIQNTINPKSISVL